MRKEYEIIALKMMNYPYTVVLFFFRFIYNIFIYNNIQYKIKRNYIFFLLQHFPLYRTSDEMCNELDEAPHEIKRLQFRERWECLSKEASEQVNKVF